MSCIWDKKSKRFPRFRLDDTESEAILEYFKSQGIVWRDKRVLDIGCGTGRYALRLCEVAKRVYATDISEGMIEKLREDTMFYKKNNIVATCENWQDYNPIEEIEIVFASMTPALKDFDSFKKAYLIAKEAMAYVGWGRKRESEFLQKVFDAHHIKLELPTGAPTILEYLKKIGREANVKYLEKTMKYCDTFDNALEDISWHISIHGHNPNKTIIKAMIEEKMQDRASENSGLFSYTTQMEIGLIALNK